MPNYIQQLRKNNPEFSGLNSIDLLDQAYKAGAGKEGESFEEFLSRPGIQEAYGDEELRLNSPNLSVAGDFARGVKRGVIKNTAGTFAEIANFAARNTGWKGAENLSQDALDTLEEFYNSPGLKQSYAAATGDWKNLNHLMSATGEGGTSIAAIFVSGGIGATAKGGLKVAAKTMAKRAAKTGLKRATNLHKLTSMAAKFAPGYAASAQIAGSALMGAEQAGDIRQYEARTGEDVGTLTELSTVLPNAIIGGYLESFMPSVFVNKPLAALAKRKIGSELSKELTETGFKAWLKATGKGVGVGAAGEFVTEYAQTVLGNSLAKAGYDVDRNVLEGAFESGLVGALTGGGLGGVSSGASKAIELTAKPKDALSAKIKAATNEPDRKPPTTPPKFQGPLDNNPNDPNIPTQPTPEQELEMDTIQRASQQPDMQMSEEDQLLASITGEEAFAELSAREETIQKAEQERRPREFVTEEGILKGVEKSTDEILFAPEELGPKTREDVFKENKNWSDVTPEDKSLFVTQADYNKNRLRFNRGDTFEKEKIQTNRKTKIKTPEKKAVATGKPKPKPKVKKASGVVAKLKTVNDLLTRFKSIEEIGNLNTPSIKKRFYKVLSDAGITNRSEFKTAKTNLGKLPELTKLNKEELRFGSEKQIESFMTPSRHLVDKNFTSEKQAENYVGNTKGLSKPEVFKQENSDGTFTYRVSSATPQPTKSGVTDIGVRGPISIKKAYKRFMGKTFSFKREDVTDSKNIVDVSPIVNKIVADLQRTIRVSYGEDITEDKKGQLGISDLTGKVSEDDTMEAWSRRELNRDISAREQSDYEVSLRKLRNLEEEIELALMNPTMSSKEILQVLRGFTKKTSAQEKEIESRVKEQEAIIAEAEKTLLNFTVESDQRVTEAVAMRLQALGKLEDIKADRAEASGELSYLLYGESGKQIKKYLDSRVSGETKMTLSQIRGLQSLTSSQGRDIALGKKKSLSGLSELYAMRTPEYWLGDPDFIAYQRAKYARLEFSSPDHKFKSFEDFVSFAVEDQISEAKSKIRLNFKLHKPTKIQYPPNTPKELLFLDESISEDLLLLAKLASQEKLSVWDNPKWDAAFKRYNQTTKKRSGLLSKLLKSGKISTKEFAAYTFSLDHNLQQAGKIAAGHKSPGTIPMSSSELLEKSIRDIESFERETVTDTSRFTEDTKGTTPKIDGDVGEGLGSNIKTEPIPPLQFRVEEQIVTEGNEILTLAATANLKKAQGVKLTKEERSAAKFVKDSKIPGIKNVVLSLAAKISHGYVTEEARNIRDSKEVTASTIFFDKLNAKVAEGSNAREFLESLGEVSDSDPATKAVLKLLKNLLQYANTSELDSLRIVQSQGNRPHFKNGTIYLPEGLTNLYTVAHELIHGLVAQKINNNATGTNELKRLYELAKLAALGSENPVAGALYALTQQDDLTGLQEFATELLLNPSLQDLLKTTKDPDQPKKSLWDRFISTQFRVEEQIVTEGNEILTLAATANLKKAQGVKLTKEEHIAEKLVKDSKIPGIKNVVLSLAAKISHGYVAEEARNIRDSKDVTTSTIFFDKLNAKVAEGSNAREFLESLGEVSDSHPATKAVLKLLKNLLQHANTSELDSLRVIQAQGTRAHFKNGTIYLPEGLTNLYTVAHELIHGLVAQKINNNVEGTNELKRLYELAKLAALGSENPVAGALYALNQQDDLTGLQEFAAELLLNPSLQDLLKTTKDPDQPKKSLWDRFISTLKNILGIEADNSLLSSSVDALANLIKVEKPQDTNPVPTLYSEGRGKTKPEPVSDSEIISEYMQDVFGFSEAEIEAIMGDPFLSEKANAMVISKIGQDTLEEIAGKRLSKDEQKILDGAVDQKTENERKKSDRDTYNKEHYRNPIMEALEREGEFTKKKWYSQLALSVHSWTLTMHNMIDVMTNFKESASKEFKELFIRRVSDSESAKLKFIQAREKNLDNIFKKYDLDREKMETERTVVRDGFTNRSTGEWVPEKSMKLWNALMIYATRSNPDFQNQLAETQEGRSLENIQKEAKYLVKNLSEGHKFLADVMQKDLANQSKMVSKKISELESVYVLKNGIEISPKLREKLDNTLEGYGYFKDSDNYMPVLGRKVFANEDMLGDVAQVLQIAPEGRKRIKKEVDTSQGVNQNLFYVWSQTTRNQSHFLNYADVINDMWDVMRGGTDQGRLDNLIYKKFGPQTLESMEAYIHSIAKPTAHIAKDGVSRLATKIRGAAALSFLGWNVMTMAKQVPSFAYFFAKVNPSFMLRTVQQAVEPGGFKKILEFVKQDAQMFDRQIEQVLDELDSMDSGMFEKLLGKALSKTPGLPPEVALKVKKKTFKSLMLGIRAADQVVTSIGYYAAYQQATKEGLSEEDARFKALQVVVNSQPASNVKDVGRLWRHNSITSTFLMFTNQLAKIYNMGMHDVLLKGLNTKTFDKEMAATSIALSMGALGIGIISHGFRWEDDDEETGFVREGVDMLGAGAVSTIPFFGGSMAAAWAGYPSPTDLGKSLGYNAVKTGLNLVQGEFAKATKSAMRTTLFPGQAELLRVWQAFDSSSPEYGITRLAGAKRVFDSEESLIPIIRQYKKALEYERLNSKEISEIKKEVRRLKRKAANAGRAGRAGEAARARREATQLKSSIESGKWKHKIEALTKKWSLDKQKVNQLMRSM